MRILDTILDILFPKQCRGCGNKVSGTAAICESCLLHCGGDSGYTCGVCHGRIPRSARGLPPRAITCHPRMAYLLISLTQYHSPQVRQAVHALKFRRCEAVAEQFGAMLAAQITALGATGFTYVVPVPLSAQRLRERGFNQAELLASAVSCRLSLPIRTNILIRRRNTKAQSTLHSRADRIQNVSASFAVRSGLNLAQARILLIDDVTTSGATLAAAAHALKEAGAGPIVCAVIARA